MTTPLGKFLAEEMRRRDLSARAFARKLNVSHGTIMNYVNGKDILPSLDFLVRLVEVTGIDLSTLLALAFPNIKTQPDPQVVIAMERYLQLPEAVRNLIDGWVMSQNIVELPNGEKE